MPRVDASNAVRVEGLAKLNRDLGRIDRQLRNDSLKHLRVMAGKVRERARANAPKRTGKLAGSLRYSVSNRGAKVVSTHPAAAVHEYGRTISPRGVPIEIKRSFMVGRALAADREDIEQQLGDLLDGIARRNGFR